MYLAYWKFKEKPFENTPDPRFLYKSANHEEALTRMSYCIEERKGAAMLTGEYGCGKTVLIRTLLKELLRDESKYKVALIVNPSFSPSDLLKEIIFQFENTFLAGSKLMLMHRLNDILFQCMNESKKTVVIVDEAQAIPDHAMFEELRLLLNFQKNDQFLLTLLLVGQPELSQRVERLPQLKQRLSMAYHLNKLNENDISKYIDYRCAVAGRNDMIFNEPAIKFISEKTSGIPRKINTVCELSLLQGMFEKKTIIDETIVAKVIEEGWL
ncbi:MAG: AAA family ATPase [Candidatus Omnitrophota bacterium]